MMILPTFFSWLFPAANHSQRQIPMAVKDGRASKCVKKLPNVISETHRK